MKYYALKIRIEERDDSMDKAAWDKAHGNCFSDRGGAEEARRLIRLRMEE